MGDIFTREIAERAVHFVLPSIKKLMELGLLKRTHLHVVVSDMVHRSVIATEEDWNSSCILYEYSMGDRSAWELPFDKIARSKCYLSWRYGLPTQVLQTRCPHFLAEGDTIYYGSAARDGLAVACSGVQPYFDGMISEWVLEAMRALCIERREELEKAHKKGFIP